MTLWECLGMGLTCISIVALAQRPVSARRTRLAIPAGRTYLGAWSRR